MRRRGKSGMAIHTRGTTMDNPDCKWVRGRLPLWSGPDEVADDPDGTQGDWLASDRRSIEHHLATCSSCAAYRSSLTRALSALVAADDGLPAVAQAPSLWPALERRIAAHSDARGASRSAPSGYTSAQREAVCAGLDDERPLRSAWMQDSVGEMFDAVGDLVLSAPFGRPAPRRRAWQVTGAAVLAASVLALLVAMPALWRGPSAAPAGSRAEAIPVADQIDEPVPPEPEVANLLESRPDDDPHDQELPAGQLARADLPPAPSPASAPADPVATADPRPGTATRLGFDLEPGTPMPPDGRDAKPVY